MVKKVVASIMASAVIICMPTVAMAHVLVTPDKAGVGDRLVFNISVPNEEQTPIVDLKVAIPDGVTEVVPTTQEGWTIKTTSSGTGSNAMVSEIEWAGGTIPVGQRRDFSFGATVPAKAMQLDWKAYQTYADGSVVHWDQKPSGNIDDDGGNAGPYSVTQVVNDLTQSPATTESANDVLPLVISVIAVVISLGSLLLRRRR